MKPWIECPIPAAARPPDDTALQRRSYESPRLHVREDVNDNPSAMDRDTTLDRQRAGSVLVAVVTALSCGTSLPGNGGSGGGGVGGAPAACCPIGRQSFTSVVRARGFTAYEGLPVKAVFLSSMSLMPGVPETRETSVSGGAFDLDFPPDSPTCASVSAATGAGAIYIDADRDGVCTPSVDYLYVWNALGAAGSTCATVDLTPQSPICGGQVSGEILGAVQIVCPASHGCVTCPPSFPDGGVTVSCPL